MKSYGFHSLTSKTKIFKMHTWYASNGFTHFGLQDSSRYPFGSTGSSSALNLRKKHEDEISKLRTKQQHNNQTHNKHKQQNLKEASDTQIPKQATSFMGEAHFTENINHKTHNIRFLINIRKQKNYPKLTCAMSSCILTLQI